MRKTILLFSLLLTSLLLVSCQDGDNAGGHANVPYVKVQDVVCQNVPWPADYLATAAGSRAVDVRARIQGIIEKKLFREGGYVHAGDLMFQLERDQYEAAYDQAKAAYMNAEREWNRIRPLYKANAVSQKDRDAALAQYDSTKAALRQAEINLEYCQVVAPVSGYTSKEEVTVGNLVSNNSLLTTVNQTDPMYIDFSISAPDRMFRQKLQREGRLRFPENNVYEARIRLTDGRMYERAGIIDFIDSQVKVTTGDISARATFDNSDNTIMPGQYVRVFMMGDVLLNAVIIPQNAVMITDSGAFVIVVDKQNVAHRTPVKISTSIGQDYLLESGLKGGERIVVDGMLKAGDGTTVRYDDPNASKDGKPAAKAQ